MAHAYLEGRVDPLGGKVLHISMVAFHRSHQDPQDPHSNGKGAPAIDRKFRDAFAALVDTVYSRPDVWNAALEFTGVARDALNGGRVSPELVIECMRLRFPNSKENVFVRTNLYYYLASAVCDAVQERVVQGAPVSTEALHGLRGFVTAPHLIGTDLSLVAYTVFVRGLTNFYQATKDPADYENVLLPSAMMGKLSQSLHHRAVTEPIAIAEVVARLGSVPVSPYLLGDLDSLLWNTAHPNRTNVPTEVRISAIHAIADRVKAPPVSLHCEDRVGVIDACSASRLFLLIAQRCPEEKVLRAVFERLPGILEGEASAMVSSWSNLGRSSFVERGIAVDLTGELRGLLERLRDDIPEFEPNNEVFLGIQESLKQAERVESAVAVCKLESGLAKFLPRSWRERVRSFLFECLHQWNR